ncbi:MAG TPA: RNA-binding S4 domain-containing protein [Bacteroidales bacterium]|nr:RNA-binding S4 domain-containing protein [Bacteroidales bacterium]
MGIPKIRIDKWLWAVRIFKTRSLATEACRNGKISISGHTIKASREVNLNDVINIRQQQMTKTIKVIALLDKRVSAKLVPQFMEDLTPATEYEKVETIKAVSFIYRPKGTGRPTKKERRDIEKINE